MGEVLDVVKLLTSELVTNAYLHSEGPASLRLTALGNGRLRVGLWDGCPHVPPPFDRPTGDRVPLVPPDSETGRGLYLLQQYADAWGGRPLGGNLLGRGGGKLLWFEVGGRDLSPRPRPA